MRMGDLKRLYASKRREIARRLAEFRAVWKDGDEKRVLTELVFCLLTPQSKAKSCWRAASGLAEKGILRDGSEKDILGELAGVRFKYKKAKYVDGARRLFSDNGRPRVKARVGEMAGSSSMREWLVRNVKGIGYKEASHFLRNVGLGEDLAILDRHILKNLKLFGVIDEIPASLSRKRYLEIEERMRRFSGKAEIPMGALDLVLWCSQTGEIFK